MPETPDFEKIARHFVEEYGIERLDEWNPDNSPRIMAAVVEQLRLVWNARGAADIATIETSLSSQMGATASGPYLKNLDRALRTLDR